MAPHPGQLSHHEIIVLIVSKYCQSLSDALDLLTKAQLEWRWIRISISGNQFHREFQRATFDHLESFDKDGLKHLLKIKGMAYCQLLIQCPLNGFPWKIGLTNMIDDIFWNDLRGDNQTKNSNQDTKLREIPVASIKL